MIEASDEMKAVSLRVDGQVLEKVKANAKAMGLPYQTYIKVLLHLDAQEPIFGQEKSVVERLEKLIMKVEGLSK